MGIVAKRGEDFELCPAGIHSAVCYAVADLGLQENPFSPEKPIRKCVVLWEIEPRMSDNRRFGLSKFYTLSLNSKSNLRADLISWRGRDFTKEELDAGFDIERLQGANCTLNIVHETKADRTYAKVFSVMACLPGKERLLPENRKVPDWVIEMQKKQLRVQPERATTPTINPQPVDNESPF